MRPRDRQDSTVYGRDEGHGATYSGTSDRAETSASVEPVIVTELVDLDTFAVRRLMRLGRCRCHHRRFCVLLGGDAIVVEQQIGREVQVLLER